jgi:hypothetical protein
MLTDTQQAQAISLVAKQRIHEKLQGRTGDTDSEAEQDDE